MQFTIKGTLCFEFKMEASSAEYAEALADKYISPEFLAQECEWGDGMYNVMSFSVHPEEEEDSHA